MWRKEVDLLLGWKTVYVSRLFRENKQILIFLTNQCFDTISNVSRQY